MVANTDRYNPALPDEEQGMSLEDYGMLFLSRWYYFACAVLIALTIAVFKILTTTPVYQRSASVLIKTDDQKSSSAMQEIVNLGLVGSNSNINNEVLTLCAPVLMQEATKRLGFDLQISVREGLHALPLYNDAPVSVHIANRETALPFTFKMKVDNDRSVAISDFVVYGEEEIQVQDIRTRLGATFNTPAGKIRIEESPAGMGDHYGEEITVTKYAPAAIAARYSGRLSVTLADKESTILNLSISDEVPARADDLLLTLVQVYNEHWMRDRNLIAESTTQFITERLAALSEELGDVDRKISDYKSSNLMPNLQEASSMYMQQSGKNANELIQLNNQLSMAIYIKDYLSDRSRSGQLLPTNSGIGGTGVESQIAAYNQAVLMRNDLLSNSSEDNALVQKMDRDLATQKTAIVRSLENLIAQLRQQISAAEANEALTNQKIASAPRQAQQLLSIDRQQKVKEALYIYLLQKREENELSKTFTAWNTRIIQPPYGGGITAPRRGSILLIALALGLAVPGGLLFLCEFFNRTVRGRKDLESMRVPYIGEIPLLTPKKHWWQRKPRNSERKIYIKENSRNLINESFRLVRTKLDYFMEKKPGSAPVIMVTSFNAGSGKSFISGNLAKTLSLGGKRVLAIDIDLRHSSLSQMAELAKQGLSSYLCGATDNLDDIILTDQFDGGVDVIPVGVVPPNPTELLQSDRLTQLFETLRPRYDAIIVDCPPIDVVADTNIVKRHADVSLFVVRVGLMNRYLLKEVDKLYLDKTYPHMALLLNGSPSTSTRYNRYSFGYVYGYGYGEAHGYHDKE